MVLGRREFLKSSVVAGISVWVAALGSQALAALFENDRLCPLARDGVAFPPFYGDDLLLPEGRSRWPTLRRR